MPDYYDCDRSVIVTGEIVAEHYADGDLIGHHGVVPTLHGYVKVRSRYWRNGDEAAWLDFIHNGRLYTRTYAKAHLPRYLTTLARRFADEVAGNKDTKDAQG